MWRTFLLTSLLYGTSLAGERWSAKTHKGIINFHFNHSAEEGFSSDLTGLETLFFSQAEDATFRHLCFWEYLQNDPTIQSELMESFKENYPLLLEAALNSGGNMHNPKVIPLRKFFAECLLKTPSVQKIDAIFQKRGYTTSSVSHEKFRIEKTSDSTQFKAITWLVITKAKD